MKNTFEKLGITKYVMLTENKLESTPDLDIKEFSGIYIGGGNTFYLMKKLQEYSVIDKIKIAIENNIPIYGGSAGAIIFSKTIETALQFDENWPNLKDFIGLNKINNNNLFCHYSKDKEAKVKEIIKKINIQSSIALPEIGGLFITDKFIEVIGKDSAWIFNEKGNKKELKVQTRINQKSYPARKIAIQSKK